LCVRASHVRSGLAGLLLDLTKTITTIECVRMCL